MSDMDTLLPAEVQDTLGFSPKQKSKSESIFAQLGDERRLELNLRVYRKIRMIGRGAFGKAYLVEAVRKTKTGELQSQQRVMKKLPLNDINDQQREAAVREAQLLRQISRGCHFITRFCEVILGKRGTTLCIVMEFCEGGDLRHALSELDGHKLSESEVLRWVAQVGLALNHCHAHGVLHRDVKPENCFLREKGGDLLLGDFGISCALEEKSFAKTCIGSPLYLSPEIVNQEPYSYTTDVWSFGVMTYEIAMLAPPFKGGNICQLALRIMTGTPEPLDTSWFSPEFQNLINQLLEKDAKQRISLTEALQAVPLSSVTAQIASSHGLEWPPLASSTAFTRNGRSGLVQRLRGRIAGGDGILVPEEEYEDDFEADDKEGDDCGVYHDDFEELSGSEASYEQDFEEYLSDAEDGDGNGSPLRAPSWEDLSENQVRELLRTELGEDALAVAERMGVVSFLKGVRLPTQQHVRSR